MPESSQGVSGVTYLERLTALLAQTAEAEAALLAEEFEEFAAILEARGAAMTALSAAHAGEHLSADEQAEAARILRALAAADERLAERVGSHLGQTRAAMAEQQLARTTVDAYRQANRRVHPQFAARFVDQQK
jgi:hypothetical protein